MSIATQLHRGYFALPLLLLFAALAGATRLGAAPAPPACPPSHPAVACAESGRPLASAPTDLPRRLVGHCLGCGPRG